MAVISISLNEGGRRQHLSDEVGHLLFILLLLLLLWLLFLLWHLLTGWLLILLFWLLLSCSWAIKLFSRVLHIAVVASVVMGSIVLIRMMDRLVMLITFTMDRIVLKMLLVMNRM